MKTRSNLIMRTRWLSAFLSGLCMGISFSASAAMRQEDVFALSLEELLDMRITTASRLEESALVAPATVYVIDSHLIQRLGLRDLKDILRIVPGMDTFNPHFFLLGGQRGYVGHFSQTLLMINGREVNNLIAGNTFIANQFMTHNIKQVEIVNGPGSALYGANAVAGVINIITKDADPGFTGTELSATYGSHGTRRLGAVFAHQQDALRLSGSINYYESRGEDFSRFLSDTSKASPRAENNPYRWLPDEYGYRNDEQAYWISLRAEQHGFYAGIDLYQNRSGRGTAGIQWDYNQGEDHRDLSMSYVGYRHEDLWGGRMDVKAEYRYYHEKFWGNHTETDGPIVNPFTGRTTTFDTTREDIEAFRGFYSNKRSRGSDKHLALIETTLRLADWNTLIAGFSYENADVVGAAWSRTDGPHPAITPQQRRPAYKNYRWGVYAQDQAHFMDERLALTIGARYDRHERYGSTFNPRSGVVMRPVDSSIFKILYGQSFREPTVFEIQNSEGRIQPMTMQTAELGWHQFLGRHFKNEAVIYYNYSDDLIVADSTEIGGTSNRGTLNSYGLENQLNFRYGDWSGFANYTYSQGRLDEPETGRYTIYDLPRHKGNVALIYDILDNYSIGLLARYRGKVDTRYYGETHTVSDYLVCDLTLSANGGRWLGDSTRVDLMLKNLFDTDHYDSEPRVPSMIRHPQEGRSIFLQVTMTL